MTDKRPQSLNPSEIQNKTKQIYLSQHSQYLKDRDLFNRFYEYAVNPHSYSMTPEDFRNAAVLDAGCGNSAYFQKAMVDLGADIVHCVDLGTDWIPLLEEALNCLDLPPERFRFRSGSTTSIPYPDNSFDFVASNDVLMHLPSTSDAEKACSELYRVLKPGGNLYIYFGHDNPGIVDKYIVPALRDAYNNDIRFRALIDNINPATLQDDLQSIVKVFAQHDTYASADQVESILKLITVDTCTFLRNMLQVPVQQGNKLDKNFALQALNSLGAKNIRECPNHYFARKDIRRFLTPFHFTSSTNNLSNIFYGGGHLKITCTKPHE